MRITLNIDEDLLERVRSSLGVATKTETIHRALEEMDRRAKLTAVLHAGLGLTPDELEHAFDPASDPLRLRYSAEAEAARKVAEDAP